MNIAIAQMHIESANLQLNFTVMKQLIEEAKNKKADIIVFPEMCISGYLLQDKWLDHEFCMDVHSYNEKIKQLSQNIGIVFGNLYYDNIENIAIGRDGRKARFNTVLFAYNKQWVKREDNIMCGIHIKHLNPDYRIFDDSRYFLSGLEVSQRLKKTDNHILSPFVFEKDGVIKKIGLQVCEDLWSNDYGIDATEFYANQNTDFIINVSSSPYTLNKELARDKRILQHANHIKEKMIPIIYVNACGMQNTGKNIVLFDGGSSVYDTNGKRVFSLNDRFKQELNYYDFNVNNNPLNDETKLLDALTYAVQEIDKQMFNKKIKWIIGLSGGIDSCINACLLVKALGNERIIGYNMASNHNSLTTKNNARQLAQELGIELREGSIEILNQSTLKTMQMYHYNDTYSSLVYENIQARIRGHLLSTFASIEGGVIINNANKIEVALGYCTLYGDCIGAFSPLGDLTKVQCFEIAKQCNDYFKKEVISTTLIPNFENGEFHWEMPPSAELKDAQLDPMKWYYHDFLIAHLQNYPTAHIETIMESYLDDSIYDNELGKWIKQYNLHHPQAFIEDLEWLLKTMQFATFKRIQMPPILLLSRGAYGSDYREAQLQFFTSEKYQLLKKKILKKQSV